MAKKYPDSNILKKFNFLTRSIMEKRTDNQRPDISSPEEDAAFAELEKKLAQAGQGRSRVTKTVKPKQDQATEA
jgi:hypothetical protein